MSDYQRKSKPKDPLMQYARNGRGKRTIRRIRKYLDETKERYL